MSKIFEKNINFHRIILLNHQRGFNKGIKNSTLLPSHARAWQAVVDMEKCFVALLTDLDQKRLTDFLMSFFLHSDILTVSI